MKYLLSLALVSCWSLAVGFAQEKKYDQRVKDALERRELKYTQMENGNFKVTFGIGSAGRSQNCFVVSSTETYMDVEIREIFALAYKGKKPLDASMMERLLMMNNKKKAGAWGMEKTSSGDYLLFFQVKLDANATPKVLQEMMELTSKVADELEEELTGKTDEF